MSFFFFSFPKIKPCLRLIDKIKTVLPVVVGDIVSWGRDSWEVKGITGSGMAAIRKISTGLVIVTPVSSLLKIKV